MKIRTPFVAAFALIAAVAATGCGHLMMMMHGSGVARPAETEFGTGPRASASRQFTATLQPDQPLRPRRMQTVRVAIADAAGAPADNAKVIDFIDLTDLTRALDDLRNWLIREAA